MELLGHLNPSSPLIATRLAAVVTAEHRTRTPVACAIAPAIAAGNARKLKFSEFLPRSVESTRARHSFRSLKTT